MLDESRHDKLRITKTFNFTNFRLYGLSTLQLSTLQTFNFMDFQLYELSTLQLLTLRTFNTPFSITKQRVLQMS